jgi:hypothetical protein
MRSSVIIIGLTLLVSGCQQGSASATSKACPKISATYTHLETAETALATKYGGSTLIPAYELAPLFVTAKTEFLAEITPLDDHSPLYESTAVFAATMSIDTTAATHTTLGQALAGMQKACNK